MPAKGYRKIDDLDQLEQFMRLKPSLKDTAAFFKCSTTTVEDTIRKEYDRTFREFRDERMVHTRHALVRKAIEMALSGNTTMMIFCLKNVCGWNDKKEVSVEDSSDKKLIITMEAENDSEQEHPEEEDETSPSGDTES